MDPKIQFLGNTAVSICIPQFKIKIGKRTSNHLSIYSAETILIALNWVEQIQPLTVIHSIFNKLNSSINHIITLSYASRCNRICSTISGIPQLSQLPD